MLLLHVAMVCYVVAACGYGVLCCYAVVAGEGSSYGIRVATGSMSGGGTHITSVYVRLIGNRGDSGNVSLTGFFSTGVSTGTFEDLLVETERSLGEVQVVIIGIKGALIDDAWFVEYSTVYDFGSGKETRFPCYHWIKKNEMVTTTSKASEYCYVSVQCSVGGQCSSHREVYSAVLVDNVVVTGKFRYFWGD